MLGEYSAEIVRVVAIVITASMTVDQLAVAQFAPRPSPSPEPAWPQSRAKFSRS